MKAATKRKPSTAEALTDLLEITKSLAPEAAKLDLLRSALLVYVRRYSPIENGRCTICGAHRLWMNPRRKLMDAGPCENPHCDSRVIDMALKAAEVDASKEWATRAR